MELKKHIKKIVVIGMGALFLGATIGCTPAITQEDVDIAVADAKANGFSEGAESVDITSDNEAIVSVAVEVLEAQSARDAQIIEDYKLELNAIEEQVVAETSGYIIDDLGIGDSFSVQLSDRQIDLFDGEVRFDGDDYDAEEVLTLSGTVAVNEEDFDSKVLLKIDEGGVLYEFVLDSELDTSEITSDDTLTFDFLGEEVEIADWDVDEVTFTKGDKFFVKEGEVLEIDGKQVEIKVINDDYAVSYTHLTLPTIYSV